MHEALKPYLNDEGKLDAYAWPGGYPLIYVTKSSAILCPKCATEDLDLNGEDSDDPPVDADVHWEGPPEQCEGCNEMIESAYGDPDEDDVPQEVG